MKLQAAVISIVALTSQVSALNVGRTDPVSGRSALDVSISSHSGGSSGDGHSGGSSGDSHSGSSSTDSHTPPKQTAGPATGGPPPSNFTFPPGAPSNLTFSPGPALNLTSPPDAPPISFCNVTAPAQTQCFGSNKGGLKGQLLNLLDIIEAAIWLRLNSHKTFQPVNGTTGVCPETTIHTSGSVKITAQQVGKWSKNTTFTFGDIANLIDGGQGVSLIKKLQAVYGCLANGGYGGMNSTNGSSTSSTASASARAGLVVKLSHS